MARPQGSQAREVRSSERAAKSFRIDEEQRFLARVAWACEIEGVTQAEAAVRFGVTRLRVNRALGEARRRGIVRVSINSPYASCAETEAAIVGQFGLRAAYVAPSPTDPDDTQSIVGAALGHHLSTVLARPEVTLFGMAWGNTLNLATDYLTAPNRPDLEVVSVMGGLTRGSALNSFEITTRLANLCNARHSYFTAPLYAGSAESRKILLRQDVFKEVLDKIRGADAIAVAVGDMSKRSLLVSDGLPSDAPAETLVAAGAVGDVLGYVLDAQGRPIRHAINQRVLGVELEDLRPIPNVILAAGGQHKVPIIRAVLGLGLVDTLVTDDDTAQAVLKAQP